MEQIILERFGSKSMRIFRYIREKKYVEENQIQQVNIISLLKVVFSIYKKSYFTVFIRYLESLDFSNIALFSLPDTKTKQKNLCMFGSNVNKYF